MVLQPFRDEAFPGTVIQAGTVGVDGQEKRTVIVPNNRGSGKDYVMHFFGFTTKSSGGVIRDVSVITYDPEALFRSRFDFPALDSAARVRRDSYNSARAKVAELMVNDLFM